MDRRAAERQRDSELRERLRRVPPGGRPDQDLGLPCPVRPRRRQQVHRAQRRRRRRVRTDRELRHALRLQHLRRSPRDHRQRRRQPFVCKVDGVTVLDFKAARSRRAAPACARGATAPWASGARPRWPAPAPGVRPAPPRAISPTLSTRSSPRLTAWWAGCPAAAPGWCSRSSDAASAARAAGSGRSPTPPRSCVRSRYAPPAYATIV